MTSYKTGEVKNSKNVVLLSRTVCHKCAGNEGVLQFYKKRFSITSAWAYACKCDTCEKAYKEFHNLDALLDHSCQVEATCRVSEKLSQKK